MNKIKQNKPDIVHCPYCDKSHKLSWKKGSNFQATYRCGSEIKIYVNPQKNIKVKEDLAQDTNTTLQPTNVLRNIISFLIVVFFLCIIAVSCSIERISEARKNKQLLLQEFKKDYCDKSQELWVKKAVLKAFELRTGIKVGKGICTEQYERKSFDYSTKKEVRK